VIRYEFPWPPRELSPNARVHWARLAWAKQHYKASCGWAIKAEMSNSRRCDCGEIRMNCDCPVPSLPLQPPVTAQVTFVCDARRRDPDNHMAMLKPLWDALVEMGVLEDDSHDKLKILDPKWERGPEKKVIVELSPYRTGGE